jgi:hypothetical protein
MRPKTKILIALAVVILFVVAFVVISTSPRRRIAPRSIVLVDTSKTEPVKWLLVSNATPKSQTVNFRGVSVWQGSWLVEVQSHKAKMVIVPGPLSITGNPQMMVSEELKGPERWLQAAQNWISHRKQLGLRWNPLNGTYYGHQTDKTAEFLKRDTNVLAEAHK